LTAVLEHLVHDGELFPSERDRAAHRIEKPLDGLFQLPCGRRDCREILSGHQILATSPRFSHLDDDTGANPNRVRETSIPLQAAASVAARIRVVKCSAACALICLIRLDGTTM